MIGRDDLFEAVLRRLVEVYETASENPHPATAVPAPLVGRQLLERMQAVGGLAVREQRWDLVRALSVQRLRTSAGGPPFWLAHIQRLAERGDFLLRYDSGRPRHVWVLSRAAEAVGRNPWLAPDVAAGDERLVTSLCEFDLLAALAMFHAHGSPSPRLVFANFAGWYSQRTDPMVAELLDEDSRARRAIFPRDDEQLANALQMLAKAALNRWGTLVPPWDGFEEERIREFLSVHAD